MDLIRLGICGRINLWIADLKPALRGSVRCQDQPMRNRYFLPLLFDYSTTLTADLLGTSQTQSWGTVLHSGDAGISILATPYREAIIPPLWSCFVLSNNYLSTRVTATSSIADRYRSLIGLQQIPHPVPIQCHTSNYSLAWRAPSERNKRSLDSFWEQTITNGMSGRDGSGNVDKQFFWPSYR